jgi:hypothetical protein
MFGFTQVKSEVNSPTQTSEAVSMVPEQPDQGNIGESDTDIQITPTPLPTIDPISKARSCLANTWLMDGLSDYVVAVIPQDFVDEYDLQYEGSSGIAYFVFSADGQVTFITENLEMQFTTTAYVFEIPVTVRMDGIATGNYEIDTTNLTFTDFDTSGLTTSAKILEEDIVDPDQIKNLVPFINPPFNTATYTCQEDVLELSISDFPNEIPPLVFKAEQ